MNFASNSFYSLLLILGLIISGTAYAQKEDVETTLTKKYARTGFREGDYEFAIENLLKLYKKNEADIDINYQLGVCYLETNLDKTQAIPHLEFVANFKNHPVRTKYYLGKAYMLDYRFTEAVEAFYDYKLVGINPDLMRDADRLIQMCYYAQEKINQPANINFERLDSTINSPFDDYHPFITKDGKYLLFTSNRTYIQEFQDYISDVFVSRKEANWTKAQQVETSSYEDQDIVSMNAETGKYMVYTNGDYSTHDVHMDLLKSGKSSKENDATLPSDMNTPEREMGACISNDGNTIIFSSNRQGGWGGLDLYIAKKGADGKWMPAENMGSTINTAYDENFPNLSIDGMSLIFASKGHDCIGGYDLQRSFFNTENNQWTRPLPLDFRINTPDDNTSICFNENGTIAYLAANRKEGYGKLDIYKITFGDKELQGTFIEVKVFVESGRGKVPYSADFSKAYATIYDQWGNVYSRKDIDPEEGNYFAQLYPGKYTLEVKFAGNKSGIREDFKIEFDTPYITREYTLKN